MIFTNTGVVDLTNYTAPAPTPEYVTHQFENKAVEIPSSLNMGNVEEVKIEEPAPAEEPVAAEKAEGKPSVSKSSTKKEETK